MHKALLCPLTWALPLSAREKYVKMQKEPPTFSKQGQVLKGKLSDNGRVFFRVQRQVFFFRNELRWESWINIEYVYHVSNELRFRVLVKFIMMLISELVLKILSGKRSLRTSPSLSRSSWSTINILDGRKILPLILILAQHFIRCFTNIQINND